MFGTVVGLSIGLFAVAISLDLVLRLAKVGNLAGMQEIVEYLLFAGVFLGAPWVLRMSGHVRVDLIISSLPPKASAALDRCLDVLGLGICLALIWFGIRNLSDAYIFKSMQMKYFTVPEWWLLAVFVVSFLMLAFEFLSRLIRGTDTPEHDAAADDMGAV